MKKLSKKTLIISLQFFVLISLSMLLAACGDKSKLAGKWFPKIGEEISSDFPEESLEILKDGTGISEGIYGFDWKIDNKRLVFTASLFSFIYNYTVSDSILTLTTDNGKSVKYEKTTYIERRIAAATGIMTDNRDGKKYKTVNIGNQTWMAENLDYSTDGSKCYGDDAANCEKYGRLYDWNTAINACPAGWHLPDSSEWNALAREAGGEKTLGKYLKAAIGWNDYKKKYGGNSSGNGQDAFGFSALPGGTGDSKGKFHNVGSYGYLWSASKNAYNGYIYYRSISHSSDGATWFVTDKSNFFSIRCLQGGTNQNQSSNPSVDSSANPVESNNEKNAALTDSRDSKTYKTVKIGTQTWMAENLGYAADGSKCYGDDAANCEKYGRLYNWSTAAKACPAGWHLPKDNDFETLIITVGGSETAGKHLKAKSGWSGNSGADTYGFAVLPGGRYGTDGVFAGAGDFGLLWSALEENASYAYRYILDNSHERMEKYHNDKKAFLSVRCVKY